jgi:HlyD family secretion protein
VTYNVVIDVGNPDQKLKPGMTANLTITIDERNNVLKVPNSALRFTPQRTDSSTGAGGQGQGQGRRRQQQQGDNNAQGNGGENRFAPASAPVLPGQVRVVWVLGQDGKPERRRITVGLSDGAATEVVDGDLKEGDMVITGQQISGASRTTTNSTPPGFGGAPRGTGGGGPRR